MRVSYLRGSKRRGLRYTNVHKRCGLWKRQAPVCRQFFGILEVDGSFRQAALKRLIALPSSKLSHHYIVGLRACFSKRDTIPPLLTCVSVSRQEVEATSI